MMKCPNCDSFTERKIEGNSEILYCDACGWSLATSTDDKMYDDDKSYTITITQGNTATKEILKVLAEITGKNFISARDIIISAPAIIFEGTAPETKSIKKKLDASGVKYKINPDFAY